MRVNDEIECSPRPRLSIKVGYFLSDTTIPDCGALHICPGSHLIDALEIPQGKCDPPGAIPVAVKPGTAVLFDRQLWHSRSLNVSDVTRKAVFFGYAYRWLQRKDDMQVERLYDRVDPIQRQLLGCRTSANELHDPKAEDVPLRAFLESHDRLDTARDHHPGRVDGKSPR